MTETVLAVIATLLIGAALIAVVDWYCFHRATSVEDLDTVSATDGGEE